MSFLPTLQATIQDRQARPQPGSYTAQLFAMGQDEIIKKVGEEATQVILAAKGRNALSQKLPIWYIIRLSG